MGYYEGNSVFEQKEYLNWLNLSDWKVVLPYKDHWYMYCMGNEL